MTNWGARDASPGYGFFSFSFLLLMFFLLLDYYNDKSPCHHTHTPLPSIETMTTNTNDDNNGMAEGDESDDDDNENQTRGALGMFFFKITSFFTNKSFFLRQQLPASKPPACLFPLPPPQVPMATGARDSSPLVVLFTTYAKHSAATTTKELETQVQYLGILFYSNNDFFYQQTTHTTMTNQHSTTATTTKGGSRRICVSSPRHVFYTHDFLLIDRRHIQLPLLVTAITGTNITTSITGQQTTTVTVTTSTTISTAREQQTYHHHHSTQPPPQATARVVEMGRPR